MTDMVTVTFEVPRGELEKVQELGLSDRDWAENELAKELGDSRFIARDRLQWRALLAALDTPLPPEPLEVGESVTHSHRPSWGVGVIKGIDEYIVWVLWPQNGYDTVDARDLQRATP